MRLGGIFEWSRAVRSGLMGRFVRGDEQKVTTEKSEFLTENFL